MTIRRKKLPIAALERIDNLCAAFERRWQSGQPETIEASIPSEISPEEKELLLSELIVSRDGLSHSQRRAASL